VKNLLTQKDFDLLQEEIKTLKTKIENLKVKLGEAAAHGGAFVCKIPEYDSLTTQIDLIENRINGYRDFLDESEILELKGLSTNTISPYSLVTVEDEKGEIAKYYLVYPFVHSEKDEAVPVSPNSLVEERP
jgi:transcription elongation GreA/GreB family factor